jgi:ABC-type lipoprotein export system ATPase subunit
VEGRSQLADEPVGGGLYAERVPVLSTVGLVKRFGVERAVRAILDGASLEVAAGELVAVIGRSGSGKSTLLHLLGGLDRPDAGSVTVDGMRLDGLGERQLARVRATRVGFVFQFFHLVPELSGIENVALPTRLAGAPRRGRKRAARLVEQLGLGAVADALPQTLSGGEQQRFAIARALVNDPPLLLADEPTGNLDRDSGAVGGAGGPPAARSGRAVVVVTHDAEVAAIADRLLRLEHGRLVPATLPPLELVAR